MAYRNKFIHSFLFEMFLTFFALPILYLLLPFPTAITAKFYSPIDDHALFAQMRGSTKFKQFCAGKGVTNKVAVHLLSQYYGSYVGILDFLRQNWNCDRVWLSPVDREECNKYHSYMDIFYKYLFTVHINRSMEPILITHYPDFIGNFIGTMQNLLTVSLHYFCWPSVNRNYFMANSELKKAKKAYTLPITPDETKREKFDQLMQKTGINTWNEIVRSENEAKNMEMPSSSAQFSSGKEKAAPKCVFNFKFPIFYDIDEAIKEEAFLNFVKGQILFTHLLEMDPKLTQIDQIKMFEDSLCLLYSMKKNWDCKQLTNREINKCKEMQQYVNIIYEYLFKVHSGIPSVKPIFGVRMHTFDHQLMWHRVTIRNLNNILLVLNDYTFDHNDETYNGKIEVKLMRNNDNNSEIPPITFEEQLVQIAKERSDRRNEDKNGQQINATEAKGIFRQAFDIFLQEIFEKKIKSAIEAKIKLDVLKEKLAQSGSDDDDDDANYQFDRDTNEEKYRNLLDSPFLPEMPENFFGDL